MNDLLSDPAALVYRVLCTYSFISKTDVMKL